MTKPSYEELEPEQRWIMQNWYRVVPSAENRHGFTTEEVAKLIHERVETAETSLARVRGLLQRVNVLSSRLWSMAQGMDEGGDVEELALQLETLAEQAESADIGKLDAADKSGSREPEKLNNGQNEMEVPE